jgi:hypothetical protein
MAKTHGLAVLLEDAVGTRLVHGYDLQANRVASDINCSER